MRFICNFALGVDAEIRPWGSWGRVSVNCTWDECTLGGQQGGGPGWESILPKVTSTWDLRTGCCLETGSLQVLVVRMWSYLSREEAGWPAPEPQEEE